MRAQTTAHNNHISSLFYPYKRRYHPTLLKQVSGTKHGCDVIGRLNRIKGQVQGLVVISVQNRSCEEVAPQMSPDLNTV